MLCCCLATSQSYYCGTQIIITAFTQIKCGSTLILSKKVSWNLTMVHITLLAQRLRTVIWHGIIASLTHMSLLQILCQATSQQKLSQNVGMGICCFPALWYISTIW